VLIEALRSSASVTAHTGWATGERRRPGGAPLLGAIRDHAVDVDIDHTRRADWEKLLELIDQLPKNGAAK